MILENATFQSMELLDLEMVQMFYLACSLLTLLMNRSGKVKEIEDGGGKDEDEDEDEGED